jgi:hypothetical protein
MENTENTENIGEEKVVKKSNKATKERMKELNEIKKKKNEIKKAEKEELKKKLEEIEKLKKERIELEYQQALRNKSRIEEADEEEEEEEEEEVIQPIKRAAPVKARQAPAPAELYKKASRDILKDKYIEEVKKRVMSDLFS